MSEIVRLPPRWRLYSREVEPAEGNVVEKIGYSNGIKPMVDAAARGMHLIFHPALVKDYGHEQWRVAVFADAMHLMNWGGGTAIEVLQQAELLASYFPGSTLVEHQPQASRVAIAPIRASDWASVTPQKRTFLLPGLIPQGEVTALYGDGGTGKSMIALQLAIAMVTGTPWLGKTPLPGPALFITAEDEADEVHRRTRSICAANGLDVAGLGDLEIVSLVGEDAVVGMVDPASGTIERTPLFDMIEQHVIDRAPALVVLDTLADMFSGDFLNPNHIKRFVNLLKRLTLHYKTSVLLLAHPSVAGMASGMGTSHAVAWNNSVRSRLYLSRIYVQGRKDELVEPDPDARMLTNKKMNYGRTGAEVKLRWSDGAFIEEAEQLMLPAPAQAAAMASADDVEAKFLSMLAAFTVEGQNVSNAGPKYAPAKFAKDPRADGMRKAAFADAMARLFAQGRIAMVPYGPPAKGSRRIEVVK